MSKVKTENKILSRSNRKPTTLLQTLLLKAQSTALYPRQMLFCTIPYESNISPIGLTPDLAPILTRYFRISFVEGIFPDSWKDTPVQTVSKYGSKIIAKYRPTWRPFNLFITYSMEFVTKSTLLILLSTLLRTGVSS